jgi:hypothetical protein
LTYSSTANNAGAGLQPVSNCGVEFVTQLARQGQELSESGFTGLKDWQDKATAIVGGAVLWFPFVIPLPPSKGDFSAVTSQSVISTKERNLSLL